MLPGTAVLAEPRQPDWGGADLSVRLEASPKRAQPGQPLLYRVDVRNAGPGDAVLPVLTVRLPAGVKIFNADVAECRPGPGPRVVVCASDADVPAGSTGGVTITGVVRPGARGPLTATASITSEVVDDNAANDSARLLTPVAEGADLGIRLTDSSRAGRTVTMDATVHNRGPRTVRDALVLFRAGRARFVAARGARCRPYPVYVGCALRAVGSGERVRLRLSFRTNGRTVRAEAAVYSAHLGDRRPRNNVARLLMR
ncbi:hypothetical protein GCM10010156_45790 [Planobispora rosea]|uniref:DUF11 domain-containing protein n=2 Tax=Planobispora rosea TaxID=35762 RepID=A0A8J3WEC5_PLARO|nr:hypothetical protein GCM10010156_45790 [Planobispora rosea]GIH86088.1 hypothetical protein Pro02_44960 [Planobispora rosea]